MAGEDVALKIILSAIDDTGSGLKSASEKLQKTGETMQRIGTMATVGLTAPLLVLGKTAIDSASDMAESYSKMQVVFGSASGVVDQFTKRAATNLGMSRQAALEAAGTFGNLFVAMKIGQPQAAEMSTSILKLAADLASFNNVKPEEALEALKSGLVGETEPLRRFGVNLSAVRIQAEAVRLGLAKQGETLTAAAQAQAAYSLILQDTKTAQGDFARTSSGNANSQRILTAQFQDASAQLGQSLLPIMLQGVTVAKQLMTSFNGLSGEQQRNIVIAAGVLAALGPIIGVIGTLITVVNAGAAAVTFLANAQVVAVAKTALVRAATIAWTAVQWLLNVALSANPIGLVIVAVAALAAGVVWAYQNVGWFHDAVNIAWSTLQGWASWLGSHLQPILQWLGDRLHDIAGVLSVVGSGFSALGSVHIPGFASGGVVPGPVGAPMLAVVHGGERVVPVGGNMDDTNELLAAILGAIRGSQGNGFSTRVWAGR